MPGVRLNVGKRGLSVTAGGTGARVTVGSRGTTVSGGLPGTGLGFQKQVGGRARKVSDQSRETVQVQVSLHIEDDGTVGAYSNGERLAPKYVTAAFKQKPDGTRKWLEAEAQQRNAPIQSIAEVHLQTPPPVYRTRLERSAFSEVRPQRPRIGPYPIEPPDKPAAPKTGGLARLVPGLVRKRESRFERAHAEFEVARAAWKREKAAFEDRGLEQDAAYEQRLEDWRRRRDEHDASELARIRDAEVTLVENEEAMAETLTSKLSALDWPLETLVNFEVTDSGRVVSLDIDLPEVEDLPDTQAEMSKTGRRLLIKKLSQTSQRKLYARHIHGISLRLLSEVFAALPSVEEVVLSGYSQRLESSTGRVRDEYLLSVRASREKLSAIDFAALEHVDPVEAVGALDCRRKMTRTGVFRPVEPQGLN